MFYGSLFVLSLSLLSCHCPSVDTKISVQYFVLIDLYLRYYHNNAGAFWKQEVSGSWSYGSWISNYLCNRWLSRISIMARCTWYNFTWISLLVTCDRSVIFSGYSGFLHQYNWPSRYNWNIVESGVKHHNHNPVIDKRSYFCIILYIVLSNEIKIKLDPVDYSRYLYRFLLQFGKFCTEIN
jgi:hypothetical protein